jgi:hypothetical protein
MAPQGPPGKRRGPREDPSSELVTAPTAVASLADRAGRQVDIRRSLPDFVVWRWRLADDRVCKRGEHVYNQACPEHPSPGRPEPRLAPSGYPASAWCG